MSDFVLKKCKDCGIEKYRTRSNFYRDRKYRDGYTSYCKVCKRKQVAENYALKADAYRERKREISARPYYVAQRAAYNRSERGREVMRQSKQLARMFKALEMRA